MFASWIKETIELIDDLASGKVTIEDARKRAAILQARRPEQFTDALLGEMDAKIAALESPDGASDR